MESSWHMLLMDVSNFCVLYLINFCHSLVALFILFVMCGVASIPLAYLFSGMFKKPSTSFSVLAILYIITGIVFSVATKAMDAGVSTNTMSKATYDFVLVLFRISPVFSMSWAVSKVYKAGLQPALCKRIPEEVLKTTCAQPGIIFRENILPCCVDRCRYIDSFGRQVDKCAKILNPWTWGDDGIGEEMLMMSIVCLIAFGLLVMVEVGFVRFFRQKMTKVMVNAGDQVVSHLLYIPID